MTNLKLNGGYFGYLYTTNFSICVYFIIFYLYLFNILTTTQTNSRTKLEMTYFIHLIFFSLHTFFAFLIFKRGRNACACGLCTLCQSCRTHKTSQIIIFHLARQFLIILFFCIIRDQIHAFLIIHFRIKFACNPLENQPDFFSVEKFEI